MQHNDAIDAVQAKIDNINLSLSSIPTRESGDEKADDLNRKKN